MNIKSINKQKMKRYEIVNQWIGVVTLSIFLISMGPLGVPGTGTPQWPRDWGTAGPKTQEGEKNEDKDLHEPKRPGTLIPKPEQNLVVLGRVSGLLKPQAAMKLELGGMRLEFPEGSVETDTEISIEELGDVAELNPGMENAGKRVAGYRALPHGTFKNWVKVFMGYDSEKVQGPGKLEELYTYFYNEKKRVWTKLERVRVDQTKHEVESVTNHFTDFINGTLKVPETAKPLNFNPTMIKDIKAADPSAGVGKLEGFEANNQGSAGFQVKLNLPSGRAGMMPGLTLSYSSSGSSGWLGQGFDLGVGSVGIDTRFGVPKFDGNDLYTLNGQPLVWDSVAGYYRTKIDGFNRIFRKPGNGHQYYWEVQEKSGRKQIYGQSMASRRGPGNNDAIWMLEKTIDIVGNEVTYFYSEHLGQLYLERVNYTGFNGTPGAYDVVFLNEDRPDRRFEARNGYVSKMAKRLSQVKIQFQGVDQRIYKFNYGLNLYGKSQLNSFEEQDGSSKKFYQYDFEYVEPVKDGEKVIAFQDEEIFSRGLTDFGGSTTLSGNLGAYLGVGIGFEFGDFKVGAEVGVSAGIGGNLTWENSKILDVSGDGIPDIIKHYLGQRAFLLNPGKSAGLNIPYYLPFAQLEQPTSKSWKWDLGVSSTVSLGALAGASVGGSYSETRSFGLQTYSDFDGDGLVDFISTNDNERGKYYKNVSTDKEVRFTPRNFQLGSTVSKITSLDSGLKSYYFPLDPLLAFQFPYSGIISQDFSVEQDSGKFTKEELDSWDGIEIESYFGSTLLGRSQLNGKTSNLKAKIQSDVDVKTGKNIYFRVHGGESTDRDEVNWNVGLRYKKVKLYEGLQQKYITFLPGSFDSPYNIQSGDLAILEKAYTKSYENSHDVWKKNANISPQDIGPTLLVLLKYNVACWVPSELSLDFFKANRFSDGQYPSDNLGNHYEYNFLNNSMKLKASSSIDQGSLEMLRGHLFIKKFDFQNPEYNLGSGLKGTLNPLSPKEILSSDLDMVLSGVTQGELGFQNQENEHIIEILQEIDGTNSNLLFKPKWENDTLTGSFRYVGSRQEISQLGKWFDTSPIEYIDSGDEIQILINSFSGDQRTFKLKYSPLDVLTKELGFDVGGSILVSEISRTKWDLTFSELSPEDQAIFETNFDSIKDAQDKIVSYKIKENLDINSLTQILWIQVKSGICNFGYDATISGYKIGANNINIQSLKKLKNLGLINFTNINEKIWYESDRNYVVKTRTFNGQIQEYGSLFSHEYQGEADYIELLTKNGSMWKVTPVYIKRFNINTDINNDAWNNAVNYPGLDGKVERLPIENNLLRAFSGGGNHWFFAEWKGSREGGLIKPFEESLIRTQLNIWDDPKSTDQIKNDCQVIWQMTNTTGNDDLVPNAWIGRIFKKTETTYNSDRSAFQTVEKSFYPFIARNKVQSYRVGGEGSLDQTTQSRQGEFTEIRKSEDSSWIFNLGLSSYFLGGFSPSVAYSIGASSGKLELLDINGDRLPDKVEEENGNLWVNFNQTNADLAGLAFDRSSFGGGTLSRYINRGVTIGGTVRRSSTVYTYDLSPSGQMRNMRFESSSNGSLGASYTVGASYKVGDLQDFNGDGLPDVVSRNGTNILVKVNGGTGFITGQSINIPESVVNDLYVTATKRFGFVSGIVESLDLKDKANTTLNIGGNSSLNLTGSLGGSFGNSPSSGGNLNFSASPSTNRSLAEFMDVNADGLPDLVYKKDAQGGLLVCFNQGDQFTQPVSWGGKNPFAMDLTKFRFVGPNGEVQEKNIADFAQLGNDWETPFRISDEISCSTSLGFSAGAGISKSWNVWIFQFTAGLNLGASIATSSAQMALLDVDGDGFLDQLASMETNEGKLLITKKSTLGKVGMLKRVFTPQGGMIEVDYANVGHSFADPSGHWVMSSVVHSDNQTKTLQKAIPEVDENRVKTNFQYTNGYYDRQQRQFWGFGEVITQRMNQDTVVQETHQVFENRDYWYKDQPRNTLVFDSNRVLISEQVIDRIGVIQAQDTKNISKWVKVLNQTSSNLESGLKQTSEVVFKDYDSNTGDPKVIENWESEKLKNRIEIQYKGIQNNPYLAGLPEDLRVYDSKQNLVRQRHGDYNALGQLMKHQSFWEASKSLDQVFEYDQYGNIVRTRDLSGYQVDISYDPSVFTYPVNVRDSLNMSSSTEYDLGLGLEKKQIDANSQVIQKDYDTFGRMLKIFSPYDSTIPALKFTYDLTSFPWKAITENKVKYDASNSDVIRTVILVDGQGRGLQTKKEAEVRGVHGWTVSPWVKYDKLGRDVAQGAPTFEAEIQNLGLYNGGTSLNGGPKTSKVYDDRDRVIETILPDNNRQKTEFGLVNLDGKVLSVVKATDPLGHVKTSYSDASGQMVKLVLDPDALKIQTFYDYDDLGQMIMAKDDQNHVTRVTYDWLGRKTSLDNPDSGLLMWEYDGFGDLWKRTDSKLRALGQSIQYIYDQHRLKEIQYPDLKRTTYVYGTSAADNNVGRVILEDNQSVKLETSYGKLGETTKVHRTIRSKLPGQSDWNYTFEYQNNYLGQWESVKYPGGEVVGYTYDRGGLVKSVQGQNYGRVYSYVEDAKYDEYSQRTEIRYGNGTTTRYTYDELRRWLVKTETSTAFTPQLMKQEYVLDANGNVKKYSHTSSSKTMEQNYEYDALDQLVGARGAYRDVSGGLAKTANYNQSFSFDRIGNLTRKTSALGRFPGKTEDSLLRYDNVYQYSPTSPHKAIQVGSMHYVYDANGNLAQEVPDHLWAGENNLPAAPGIRFVNQGNMVLGDRALGTDRTPAPSVPLGVRFFTWDSENRLVRVQDQQINVEYSYDQSGERRLKTLAGEETVYADRLYQSEGKGTDRPIGTLNVYLGQERLVSKLRAEYNDSAEGEALNVFTYHMDHIGNSSLITDYQGREYERTAFTPHGEMWVKDSLDTLDRIDVLFTGKVEDKETGLKYFGARYLNPTTGLWISGDPALAEYLPTGDKEKDKNLPGMGGVYNPVNFALYHFAGNNPIKFTDPDGRESRTLTGPERKFVHEVFGFVNYWDISDVPIDRGFNGTTSSTSFGFFKSVILSENIYQNPLSTPKGRNDLLHELYHQDQYNKSCLSFAMLAREKVLNATMQFYFGVWSYTYKTGDWTETDLSKYKQFSDIPFLEGQAQMVGDFAELYFQARYTFLDLDKKQKTAIKEMVRLLKTSDDCIANSEAVKWVESQKF